MKAAITSVSGHGVSPPRDLHSLLSPAARETARLMANSWIKSLRQVDYAGRSMRERFRYRDDSLWWFTEIYLHKMRRLDTALETVLALESVREHDAPDRLVVESADEVVREAARAFGRAREVVVDIEGAPGRRSDRAWQGYLVGLTARLSRWRPSPEAAVPARPTIAAFVHTAFWQPSGADVGLSHESYIGPVLAALSTEVPPEDLFCVGVGPRRNFRARRWWDPIAMAGSDHPMVTPIEQLASRRALDGSLALWRDREALARELTAGDAIRDAGRVLGVDLWSILRRELEAVAILQWPWSARAMDEAGAALDRLSPGVVVTYAEAGGWGRALVLEARRRGIRSVGIQHGFIYRHWLNYLHEPDEMAEVGDDHGAPIPDRTLVFDRYAAAHLSDAGHFPPGSLAITGSARLVELVARVAEFGVAAARRETRRQLGSAGDEERLVLLAAKHSEIKGELPALVAAVGDVPGVRLVIKPHPAETAEAYAPAASGAAAVSIAARGADLARLLAAADGVVTMNSTVAIDGLMLGLPALVVGLPNNLSPFVEAGVMLGAAGRTETARQLRALLYDADVRQRLARRAAAFTAGHDMRSDGRAAARAAGEILSCARADGHPPPGGP
jgi:hypothetical protein